MALEKLKDAFSKSKQECYAEMQFRKERMTTKQLSQELEFKDKDQRARNH